MHLSLELYLMVLRGELPPAVLAHVALDHLLEECPECKDAWQIFRESASLGAEGSLLTDPRHRPVAGSKARRIDQETQSAQQARRKARRDLSALLALPPERWQERIFSAQKRFRSRAFAELLLVEARKRFGTEPETARQMAELVPEVLLWTPGAVPKPWARALEARSMAYAANTLRIRGDLAAAHERFLRLRSSLAAHPLTDTQAHAEIDSLEASLRLDQRDFQAAGALLDRAVLVQRLSAPDDERLIRLLLQRASLARLEDRTQDATEDLDSASSLMDEDTPSPLRIMVQGTLALSLVDLGLLNEAEDALASVAHLADSIANEWLALLCRGVEGRIALARERFAEAEAAFSTVRAAAAGLGRDYDAALAGLDLAHVYFAQGRTAELRDLAGELVAAFQTRGVQRDALAALIMLRDAVAAETVSEMLLAAVRRQVQSSRIGPLPISAAEATPTRPT